MTEHDIEIYIERWMDTLDLRLMRGGMTQEQYDADVAKLNRYAERAYASIKEAAR